MRTPVFIFGFWLIVMLLFSFEGTDAALLNILTGTSDTPVRKFESQFGVRAIKDDPPVSYGYPAPYGPITYGSDTDMSSGKTSAELATSADANPTSQLTGTDKSLESSPTRPVTASTLSPSALPDSAISDSVITSRLVSSSEAVSGTGRPSSIVFSSTNSSSGSPSHGSYTFSSSPVISVSSIIATDSLTNSVPTVSTPSSIAVPTHSTLSSMSVASTQEASPSESLLTGSSPTSKSTLSSPNFQTTMTQTANETVTFTNTATQRSTQHRSSISVEFTSNQLPTETTSSGETLDPTHPLTILSSVWSFSTQPSTPVSSSINNRSPSTSMWVTSVSSNTWSSSVTESTTPRAASSPGPGSSTDTNRDSSITGKGSSTDTSASLSTLWPPPSVISITTDFSRSLASPISSTTGAPSTTTTATDGMTLTSTSSLRTTTSAALTPPNWALFTTTIVIDGTTLTTTLLLTGTEDDSATLTLGSSFMTVISITPATHTTPSSGGTGSPSQPLSRMTTHPEFPTSIPVQSTSSSRNASRPPSPSNLRSGLSTTDSSATATWTKQSGSATPRLSTTSGAILTLVNTTSTQIQLSPTLWPSTTTTPTWSHITLSSQNATKSLSSPFIASSFFPTPFNSSSLVINGTTTPIFTSFFSSRPSINLPTTSLNQSWTSTVPVTIAPTETTPGLSSGSGQLGSNTWVLSNSSVDTSPSQSQSPTSTVGLTLTPGPISRSTYEASHSPSSISQTFTSFKTGTTEINTAGTPTNPTGLPTDTTSSTTLASTGPTRSAPTTAGSISSVFDSPTSGTEGISRTPYTTITVSFPGAHSSSTGPLITSDKRFPTSEMARSSPTAGTPVFITLSSPRSSNSPVSRTISETSTIATRGPTTENKPQSTSSGNIASTLVPIGNTSRSDLITGSPRVSSSSSAASELSLTTLTTLFSGSASSVGGSSGTLPGIWTNSSFISPGSSSIITIGSLTGQSTQILGSLIASTSNPGSVQSFLTLTIPSVSISRSQSSQAQSFSRENPSSNTSEIMTVGATSTPAMSSSDPSWMTRSICNDSVIESVVTKSSTFTTTWTVTMTSSPTENGKTHCTLNGNNNNTVNWQNMTSISTGSRRNDFSLSLSSTTLKTIATPTGESGSGIPNTNYPLPTNMASSPEEKDVADELPSNPDYPWGGGSPIHRHQIIDASEQHTANSIGTQSKANKWLWGDSSIKRLKSRWFGFHYGEDHSASRE